MKKFTVEIINTDVYINGHLYLFGCKMDEENCEDDMSKKAILALANEMNYEPTFLFEAMVDRLGEI
jgi:hypothetical protein